MICWMNCSSFCKLLGPLYLVTSLNCQWKIKQVLKLPMHFRRMPLVTDNRTMIYSVKLQAIITGSWWFHFLSLFSPNNWLPSSDWISQIRHTELPRTGFACCLKGCELICCFLPPKFHPSLSSLPGLRTLDPLLGPPSAWAQMCWRMCLGDKFSDHFSRQIR